MINHTNQGHTISLPDSIIKECGHKLVMIKPLEIKRLFESMVKHYPVKKEDLPTIETTNIKSKTLPENYGVCSESAFKDFISTLKASVDLITFNDFLVRYPIKSYSFEV